MENKAMDDNDGENFTKVGVKRSCPENDEMKLITSSKKKDINSVKQGLVVSKEEDSSMEHESFVSSSAWKKLDEHDQLEFARAKMGEVREENQKLKMYLSRIMKDYQNLQTKFKEIVHDQEPGKKSTDSNTNLDIESDDLVSLSLGRTDSKKDETDKTSSQGKIEDEKDSNKNNANVAVAAADDEEGLTLGLDCKFDVSKSDGNETLPNPSPENSSEHEHKEEGTWSSSKGGKNIRSGDDDEVLEQNPAKKTRVSVRARCDTPTLNDGCQWRKYGQKIAKGNPCPRAYYRCTVAPLCPVRKQVQRCADDISILITTYEGTHNHPLSASATAMASTTSAAASMLLSGSTSTTNPSLLAQNTTIPANLNGLNFYLSDNNSKSKQFYLPTNSSFSSSTSHPTITLDLTSSTLPSATTASSSSSPFHRMFSSGLTYPQGPRYPSTSLNFSASPSDQYSNTLSWGGANGNFLNYGNVTTQASYSNKNTYGSMPTSSLNLGRQNSLEINPNIFQSFIPTNISSRQTLPADTIAAATKAITADPSFQSALAAALTSILGNGSSTGGSNSTGAATAGGGGGGGGGTADILGRKLNWLQNDQHRHQSFPIGATGGYISSSTMSTKGNNIACGSSYLNNSSSTGNNHQQKSLMLLPAPKTSSFSNSKSASASPTDTRDHHST